MKHKRTLLILAGNLVAFLILMQEVTAQDKQGYIYGRVTTIDNSYEGTIRWGEEETFWVDHFNASKTKDDKMQVYRDKEKDNSSSWSDLDWDFRNIWADKGHVVHQFVCQFGDIKSIINDSRSKVTLVLKNGVEMKLDGQGYNDIGSNVQIYDSNIGEVSITWSRVERVDFMSTPPSAKVKSQPIYGVVETFRKGTFKGLVQWDHDERLGHEKLDGDVRSEDVSIPFKEIQYIEKEGNGSKVILFSGREMYLTGSNDVNNENRGIIVNDPNFGRVDIPWKYFRSLTLEKQGPSGPSYSDFKKPVGIQGKVYTVKDQIYTGRILYDLDEEWECEMLEGEDDGVEYAVPFFNISSIVPKNYAYSLIKLRNGEALLLGDGRDVSDSNDGVLVYSRGKTNPTYVPWKEIIEITID